MAQRQWTTEQRQCIEARGGTLLVSAAAGSGKTSVLVQRVIGRITDDRQPVDVDRLLVVTFTKAAAAEMKQRLSAELSRLIAAHPEQLRLQRQQMLLSRASISTVHGFCTSLLREHFEQLDISPQFRVAEESEAALLREEAVSEALEEGYAQGGPAFLELASLLGSGRDDRGLSRAICRLYEFVQSHPFPDEWLADKLRLYDGATTAGSTPWGQLVLSHVRETVVFAAMLLRRALELAEEEEKMAAAYAGPLREDVIRLEQAAGTLDGCDWDQAASCLQGLATLSRLAQLRKYEDAPRKERVVALRDEAKKKLRELPDLLCGSQADCREDLLACRAPVEALCGAVRRYAALYAEKKKKKRLLDFSDLEHRALELLVTRGEDGQLGRTPLAAELSLRYEEVLVDEYQDTNAAQDALFRALSREESNLFMVGDVKQSIYGFRQAMPDLFIARRDRYPDFDGTNFPATITLGNNFRSRPQVTDAVNFVFRQLMSRQAGGIAYDRREALVCSAVYPPAQDCDTELTIIDDGLRLPPDTRDAAEARVIAQRIRTLAGSMTVTDGETERPARYGDFCILLRSKSAHAAAYADELGRCGIPAWTGTSGGFFGAPEIAVAVSLLRVIDNPMQDVPLLSVLLSPLYGFTPDDLAAVRTAERKSPLYAAVRRVSLLKDGSLPAGMPPGLPGRCAAFLKTMDAYRMLASAMPADRLIHRLFEDTGMTDAAGARRHGAQRVANLRLLHEYARRFEQGGFRGLSAFVRYLDRLEQQGLDMAPAATLSEHADVVRIMSIHNSKGLEFPVVFLAGLGGLFNTESTRGSLLLHPEYGIGMYRRDPETLRQWNTLPRQGVALAIRRSERAEELRVLYVAMTRAKEKLCLVMTLRDPAAALARLSAGLGRGETLPAYTVLSARGMGDWLLSAALRHPSGEALRSLAGDGEIPVLPAETSWRMEIVRPPAADETPADETERVQADEALYEALRARVDYRYPYAALAQIPTKLAASELSRGEEALAFAATRQPVFLRGERMTPAERGTALHTFMQFALYDAAATDLETEIARLVRGGFLTAEQGECLPRARIRRFFNSRLYGRIRASRRCLREQHFTIEIPAGTYRPGLILPEDAAGEMLVVQGIADCVFEENGALTVVDYKTDRVKTGEELAQRYAPQLRIYAHALAQTLGLPVLECLLYSFALSSVIRVDTQQAAPTALDVRVGNAYNGKTMPIIQDGTGKGTAYG